MGGGGGRWCLQYKKINTASQKQLKFKGMGCLYHFYFSHPRVGHQQSRERVKHAARGAETLIKVSFVRVRIGGCCWIPLHWGARIRWRRRGAEDARQDCPLISTTSPTPHPPPTTVRADIPISPYNKGEEETRAELVPTR